MGTAQQAEEYIKKYFKEKRHIELVKRNTWLLGLGLNQRNIIAFPQKYSLRQLNLKLSGLFQYE